MNRTITLTILIALLLDSTAFAQRLTQWTRNDGDLALGYPVPIPVDTADAFDGFRSYDGLHFKHQQLMTASENITGMVVGQTRQGRDIWAYVFSDPDAVDHRGEDEHAIMIQGGIHAREWQSPEVTAAIMDYLATHEQDGYWVEYLLDNSRFVILPVLNIDGFLQTQRFPDSSYLDSGDSPESPRDGRMRRKNMLGVDEVMTTTADHLLGVDLNRNNLPGFGSGGPRNSPDPTSLVHHGQSPASEPEIQAMQAAAEMAPGHRLRMYTDIHSFSAVVFVPVGNNDVQGNIQSAILNDFSNFHATQPGNRAYPETNPIDFQGISAGTTDEYFAQTYQIPAFTLEIEPAFETHGTDYNGLGRNAHDGFILPESEIRRVRDNMATAFTMLHYNMAGAPSVTAARIYDAASGAILYNAEWDPLGDLQQVLHVEQLQDIALDRDYHLWVSFDKPMRWRTDGQVAPFPGTEGSFATDPTIRFNTDSGLLTRSSIAADWLDTAGFSQNGYRRYRDDSVRVPLRFNSTDNDGVLDASTEVTITLQANDLVGNHLDANPATVVDFDQGRWINLDGTEGMVPSQKGQDKTLHFQASTLTPEAPFLVGQGQTAAWFDPEHSGEGFLIEMLDDGRAFILWFTYDQSGNQRWLVGLGEVRPNELYFPDLLVTSGGVFGDDFDPDSVVRTHAGSAHFIFSDCNNASMRHDIGGRPLRQSVIRLTNPVGLDCEPDGGSTVSDSVTGSWFDASHDGEGFVVEQISEDRVLIYWFTYDDQGQQAWVYGDGTVVGDEIVVEEGLLLTGGRFGAEFDPADVIQSPWGEMRFRFDCSSGDMSYDSPLPAFGSGQQSLIRLTRVQGQSCAP